MSYGNANFCIPNNFQSFFKLKRVYKEYNQKNYNFHKQ